MPRLGWRIAVLAVNDGEHESIESRLRSVLQKHADRSDASIYASYHNCERPHYHIIYREYSGSNFLRKAIAEEFPGWRFKTRTLECSHCQLQYLQKDPRRMEIIQIRNVAPRGVRDSRHEDHGEHAEWSAEDDGNSSTSENGESIDGSE